MPHRFAIYFVPPPESHLAKFGNAVLGYDCDRGIPASRVDLPGVDDREAEQMTRVPAQYGFHATLKAPFHIREDRSEADLRKAVDEFCASRAPSTIGRLTVAPIGSYVALRPIGNSASIDDLAAACVTAFDEFRTPPSAEESVRRRAAGLSARQEQLLEHWGYPYVLDEFRFHLTLAGPLQEPSREIWREALSNAFRALAGEDWKIDAIALARQDDQDAPFRVVHRARLSG